MSDVISLATYREARLAGDEFSAAIRYRAYARCAHVTTLSSLVGRWAFGVIGELSLLILLKNAVIDHRQIPRRSEFRR